MIIDAYSHVCPERLLDAISARHPGAEVAAMRCGLEFFGPERVMYGTDFPMGSSDGEDWPIEVLDTTR